MLPFRVRTQHMHAHEKMRLVKWTERNAWRSSPHANPDTGHIATAPCYKSMPVCSLAKQQHACCTCSVRHRQQQSCTDQNACRTKAHLLHFLSSGRHILQVWEEGDHIHDAHPSQNQERGVRLSSLHPCCPHIVCQGQAQDHPQHIGKHCAWV